MEFIILKEAVQRQFDKMAPSGLFQTSVAKDLVWDTYLSSFPEGTNNVYKERTEYDCNCCKQFIRACGNVVTVVDNKLVSIWDIEVGGYYQVVVDALAELVKASVIRDAFLYDSKHLGTNTNRQLSDTGTVLQWDHFYYQLPAEYVLKRADIATKLGEVRESKNVFKRGLTEITIEAAETVLELIDQKSIYRGEEHRTAVKFFLKHKAKFDKVPTEDQDNYCWLVSNSVGYSGRTRNTVIGTLLTDLSDGKDLSVAVKAFEAKVAPDNYKRPTALITKSMITKAQKTVQELGIESSLQRRYATVEDITINNILFADRTTKQAMDIFDELKSQVKPKVGSLDKVEEVSVQDFIDKILPKASELELLVENRYENNMMSLIAPTDSEAPNIFKWGNNFSWAYNGEVADSMKDRVKKAGGKVDGVLRFSIQWNDEGDNNNDFDAHCHEPSGRHLFYSNKRNITTTGRLDVDIMSPNGKVAVENITWTDKSKMQEGDYRFVVHNYSGGTSKRGFTAEVEYEGKIYTFVYDKPLKGNQYIEVATVNFTRAGGITLKEVIKSTTSSRELWDLDTEQFHKVSTVMQSPNHWDGEQTGNKHWFFMLDGCKNDQKTRGFFNEFLKEDLKEHRKVFEVLGSKMKTEESDNQLSGLGFSSTQRNSVYCKVTGNFSRVIKINF